MINIVFSIINLFLFGLCNTPLDMHSISTCTLEITKYILQLKMRTNTIFKTVAIILFVTQISGYNILLAPPNSKSTVYVFCVLGRVLISYGHNVSIILGSKVTLPPCISTSDMDIKTYRMQNIPLTENDTEMASFMRASTSTLYDQLTRIGGGIDYFRIQHEALFEDTEVLNAIMDYGYHFAVIGIATPLFILPYKLNIPYAMFGPDMPQVIVRQPFYASYVPCFPMPYTEYMTFWQRTVNIIMYTVLSPLLSSTLNRGSEFIAHHIPEIPDLQYTDLIANSSLFFTLRVPTIYSTRGSLPNLLNIGNIIGKHAYRIGLSADLRAFADNAIDGFVVVSFGSILSTDGLPKEVANKLIKAFEQFHLPIIWKVNSQFSRRLPGHIKTLPWLPQNDLVAHPNARALVMHCGPNSYIEAAYHGVPLIAFPLTVDGAAIANLIEQKKYGISLSIRNFETIDLIHALDNVTNLNNVYHKNIKKASEIIKDLPDAGESVEFWIRHVVKHGRNHLRSQAFELKWYQYFSLDSLIFILVVLGVFTIVVIRACFRCLCLTKKVKKD